MLATSSVDPSGNPAKLYVYKPIRSIEAVNKNTVSLYVPNILSTNMSASG